MAGGIDIGTGTAIVFGTSSFSASLLSANRSGMGRESIETSHMGTSTWRTHMPGDLNEPGQLEMVIQYDSSVQPPQTGAAETITITYPLVTGDASAATEAASGFLTSWDITNELETLVTATVTFQLSSTVTYTAAADP